MSTNNGSTAGSTGDGARLAVSDAAMALGIPYQRCLNMLLRGVLSGGREGKRFYVDRASVDAYLATQRDTAQPDRQRFSAAGSTSGRAA